MGVFRLGKPFSATRDRPRVAPSSHCHPAPRKDDHDSDRALRPATIATSAVTASARWHRSVPAPPSARGAHLQPPRQPRSCRCAVSAAVGPVARRPLARARGARRQRGASRATPSAISSGETKLNASRSVSGPPPKSGPGTKVTPFASARGSSSATSAPSSDEPDEVAALRAASPARRAGRGRARRASRRAASAAGRSRARGSARRARGETNSCTVAWPSSTGVM